jgi:uncharacterized lipoprotein YmbA
MKEKEQRYMPHLLTAALLVLACVGCNSLPETEYYSLALPRPTPIPEEKRIAGKVEIMLFSCTEPYDTTQVAYRSQPYRLYYDNYRRWAANPARLIRNEFVEYLEGAALFEAVCFPRTMPPPRYRIRGKIINFYELDAEGELHAVLGLRLILTDRQEDRSLTFHHREKVAAQVGPDLSGLARAMSTALHSCAERFTARVRKWVRQGAGRD